jgi:hypothetical protein
MNDDNPKYLLATPNKHFALYQLLLTTEEKGREL